MQSYLISSGKKIVIEIRSQQGNTFISSLIIFFVTEIQSWSKLFACHHVIANIRAYTSNICKYNIFTFINSNGNQKHGSIVDLSLICLNKNLVQKHLAVVFSCSAGKISTVMDLFSQHWQCRYFIQKIYSCFISIFFFNQSLYIYFLDLWFCVSKAQLF